MQYDAIPIAIRRLDLEDFDECPIRFPKKVASEHLSIAGPILTPSIVLTINDQFETLFSALELRLATCIAVPLACAGAVTKDSGVYALFRNDELAYIGSTDNLRGRLREHRSSIDGASKLNIEDMTYRIVAVGKHTAKACEGRLIEHHRPNWNSTGFGSKANGNGRRGQRASVWDEKFGRKVKR